MQLTVCAHAMQGCPFNILGRGFARKALKSLAAQVVLISFQCLLSQLPIQSPSIARIARLRFPIR
jgi:hypothetical protein